MKLVKVTTVYPNYVNQFYSGHPELVEATYSDQKRALYHDAFGWSDVWSNMLDPMGYEVYEIIANIPTLQGAWARENGVSPNESMHALVRTQIVRLKPDILFMEDYASFPADWIRELRTACPSIRLVAGWVGAPFSDASVFHSYDLILSNIPKLVGDFRNSGLKAERMMHAFDPRILSRIASERLPVFPFTFVGQIMQGKKGHNYRLELLCALARSTDLSIFGPTAAGFRDEIKLRGKQGCYFLAQMLRSFGLNRSALLRIPLISKVADLEQMPLSPYPKVLNSRLRGAVYGLNMYSTLRNSAVTLNVHIDLAKNHATNMRLFEATGSGACLLTDWRPDLATLFEQDREVMTYRSLEECVEKAEWLSTNVEKREAIAAAGQKRTLRDHTYAHRAPILDAIFQKALADKSTGRVS